MIPSTWREIGVGLYGNMRSVLALADETDHNGDGISGKPNYAGIFQKVRRHWEGLDGSS